MTTYNWEHSDWPHFRYELTKMHPTLLAIAEKAGLISGKLTHLESSIQTETLVSLMVEEAIKTSEIEGEYLNRLDVRSSIKNTLGLNSVKLKTRDKRAEGIAELVINSRNTYQEKLSAPQLFEWHIMLLSSSTNPHLKIGSWRTHDEPMQIVSGYQGRQKVHFEAPPSRIINHEMTQFIHWFNQTAPNQPGTIPFAPVRAAIAHLYFETIHPFEDGNGRIGRIIAEKALSQGLGYPVLLSLSSAIEADKKAYYIALHKASLSNEITDWIYYFINIILKAQTNVETQINFILKKSSFFDRFKALLNERELKVIQRMMQFGEQGFEGGMTAKKYMAITKTSKATATRDLQHLQAIEALRQYGSGRSVRYELNI